jgi:DNA-binding NarL/FixJ family response regulator
MNDTKPTADHTTVVVADDHPALRAAVTATLSAHGINVAGEAADGEEALAAIETHRPQVAVLDANMPRLGGIDVAARVQRTVPETALLLYTGYGNRALLVEALEAGIRGFVLKEAPLNELVRAVEVVAGGGTYVDPLLAGSLINAKLDTALPELTQRERQVLRLLADGLSNDEIGKRLFISPDTVRSNVQKAMGKLDANTRTQAVATALRQSLIT